MTPKQRPGSSKPPPPSNKDEFQAEDGTIPIPKGVSPDDVAHFSSVPLAQSTLHDPSFKMIPMSRTLTHNNRGHTLMAGTWNTPETIAHLLSFYRPESSSSSSLSADSNPTATTIANQRPEVRRFYTFSTGLNAHPDLLHGGVIATILDSTMGNIAGLCLRGILGDESASQVTAQLNVKYEKPVRTPGSVMVRAWVVRIEEGSRKMWVEGVVEGGERGEVRHAKAEGLWFRIKAGKGKL